MNKHYMKHFRQRARASFTGQINTLARMAHRTPEEQLSHELEFAEKEGKEIQGVIYEFPKDGSEEEKLLWAKRQIGLARMQLDLAASSRDVLNTAPLLYLDLDAWNDVRVSARLKPDLEDKRLRLPYDKMSVAFNDAQGVLLPGWPEDKENRIIGIAVFMEEFDRENNVWFDDPAQEDAHDYTRVRWNKDGKAHMISCLVWDGNDMITAFSWQPGNLDFRLAALSHSPTSKNHSALSDARHLSARRIVTHLISYINKGAALVERRPVGRRIGQGSAEPYLPDFYVCPIAKLRTNPIPTGEGPKHKVRYSVRGHYALRSGQRVWVRQHERGLANETFRSKDYAIAAG